MTCMYTVYTGVIGYERSAWMNNNINKKQVAYNNIDGSWEQIKSKTIK